MRHLIPPTTVIKTHGPKQENNDETMKWAVESYNKLLEYALQARIKVIIENHVGVSNDPDWMVQLMKEVNNLYFGTYPWLWPVRFTDFRLS